MPIIEKKVISVVKCSTCGKEYKTEKKALECEDSHRCECSKKLVNRLIRLSNNYRTVGFNTYLDNIFIDLEHGDLFKATWHEDCNTRSKLNEVENRDFSRINYKHLLHIDYCPLCSRKLKLTK